MGEPRCLIRAHTSDAKSKISTVVAAADVVRFQISLSSVLKVQIDKLKRPQKEKKKAQGPAKRKHRRRRTSDVGSAKDFSCPGRAFSCRRLRILARALEKSVA